MGLITETNKVFSKLKKKKRKEPTAQITVPSKDLIQIWRRNQSFTDKQKLREFNTTKPAVQQMLKDIL